MTDTLSRPTRPTLRRAAEPPRAARRSLEVGVIAATWAVCAGLVATAVPVLLVWAADARSGSGAAAAMRTAGQVWLVAHGTGVEVPGGAVGLTPLGLLALPIALLLRAAGHGARECRVTSLRGAAQLAAAMAVPYGVLAAIVAALAATHDVHPVPWQALLAGCAVGGLGGLAGALRGAGLWPAVLPALPARAVRLLIGAAASVSVIVGFGALLAGGSLVTHMGRAGDLTAATAPGKVGGIALLVVGISLVPNAAIWGAAWLAGPGFHLGIGTAVGPYGTTLGPVPSLPLLAALPGPVPGWLGPLAMCVPIAAGALAGVLVVRRFGSADWPVGAAGGGLGGAAGGGGPAGCGGVWGG